MKRLTRIVRVPKGLAGLALTLSCGMSGACTTSDRADQSESAQAQDASSLDASAVQRVSPPSAAGSNAPRAQIGNRPAPQAMDAGTGEAPKPPPDIPMVKAMPLPEPSSDSQSRSSMPAAANDDADAMVDDSPVSEGESNTDMDDDGDAGVSTHAPDAGEPPANLEPEPCTTPMCVCDELCAKAETAQCGFDPDRTTCLDECLAPLRCSEVWFTWVGCMAAEPQTSYQCDELLDTYFVDACDAERTAYGACAGG